MRWASINEVPNEEIIHAEDKLKEYTDIYMSALTILANDDPATASSLLASLAALDLSSLEDQCSVSELERINELKRLALHNLALNIPSADSRTSISLLIQSNELGEQFSTWKNIHRLAEKTKNMALAIYSLEQMVRIQPLNLTVRETLSNMYWEFGWADHCIKHCIIWNKLTSGGKAELMLNSLQAEEGHISKYKKISFLSHNRIDSLPTLERLILQPVRCILKEATWIEFFHCFLSFIQDYTMTFKKFNSSTLCNFEDIYFQIPAKIRSTTTVATVPPMLHRQSITIANDLQTSSQEAKEESQSQSQSQPISSSQRVLRSKDKKKDAQQTIPYPNIFRFFPLKQQSESPPASIDDIVEFGKLDNTDVISFVTSNNGIGFNTICQKIFDYFAEHDQYLWPLQVQTSLLDLCKKSLLAGILETCSIRVLIFLLELECMHNDNISTFRQKLEYFLECHLCNISSDSSLSDLEVLIRYLWFKYSSTGDFVLQIVAKKYFGKYVETTGLDKIKVPNSSHQILSAEMFADTILLQSSQNEICIDQEVHQRISAVLKSKYISKEKFEKNVVDVIQILMKQEKIIEALDFLLKARKKFKSALFDFRIMNLVIFSLDSVKNYVSDEIVKSLLEFLRELHENWMASVESIDSKDVFVLLWPATLYFLWHFQHQLIDQDSWIILIGEIHAHAEYIGICQSIIPNLLDWLGFLPSSAIVLAEQWKLMRCLFGLPPIFVTDPNQSFTCSSMQINSNNALSIANVVCRILEHVDLELEANALLDNVKDLFSELRSHIAIPKVASIQRNQSIIEKFFKQEISMSSLKIDFPLFLSLSSDHRKLDATYRSFIKVNVSILWYFHNPQHVRSQEEWDMWFKSFLDCLTVYPYDSIYWFDFGMLHMERVEGLLSKPSKLEVLRSSSKIFRHIRMAFWAFRYAITHDPDNADNWNGLARCLTYIPLIGTLFCKSDSMAAILQLIPFTSRYCAENLVQFVPEDWEGHFLLAKSAIKCYIVQYKNQTSDLTFPLNIAMSYLEKSASLCKDDRTLLEVKYKIISLLSKFRFESNVLSEIEVLELCKRYLPETMELSSFEWLLSALTSLKSLDKKKIFHKITYRIAKLYYHAVCNVAKALSEMSILFHYNKASAIHFINVWKGSDIELPGMHFKYVSKYIRFLADLLEHNSQLGDLVSTLLKMSKLYDSLIRYEDDYSYVFGRFIATLSKTVPASVILLGSEGAQAVKASIDLNSKAPSVTVIKSLLSLLTDIKNKNDPDYLIYTHLIQTAICKLFALLQPNSIFDDIPWTERQLFSFISLIFAGSNKKAGQPKN